MSLYYPDFHSTERTFQLLTQVAGRAGRGDRPGEVLIQTYEPKHYVLQSVAAHDDAEFYRQELASRQMLACPPFAHFLQILLTGREEDKVRQAAGDLAGILQRESQSAESGEAVVLGPSPAELGRIDNVFRWKLLVRHPEEEPLIRIAGVCLEEFRQKYRDVTAAADLNPVNMY
jgi:primosomal protein N' (replication factor Y)